MIRITRRMIAALGLVASTTVAATPGATIKREVPLNVISHGAKGTPIDLGPSPNGIVFDGLQVWVSDRLDNSVRRFDYQSNALKGSITLPCEVPDLVFDGTFVWAFACDMAYKLKSDGSKAPGFPVPLPAGASGHRGGVFDGDYIWLATSGGVVRIQVSNAAMTLIPVGFQADGCVAFDGHDVWVANTVGIAKIDGANGDVIFSGEYSGPSGVKDIAFDGRFIWVSRRFENLVDKWDPATNTVIASIPTPPAPNGMAFDGGHLWVACNDTNEVVRIDVKSNQVVESVGFPEGTRPYNAAFDGTHMWFNAYEPSRLFKFFTRFN